MTGINEQPAALRISDADRNGTLRRLHNAVALGLIDIDEFEERSARVSRARLRSDLDDVKSDVRLYPVRMATSERAPSWKPQSKNRSSNPYHKRAIRLRRAIFASVMNSSARSRPVERLSRV